MVTAKTGSSSTGLYGCIEVEIDCSDTTVPHCTINWLKIGKETGIVMYLPDKFLNFGTITLMPGMTLSSNEVITKYDNGAGLSYDMILKCVIQWDSSTNKIKYYGFGEWVNAIPNGPYIVSGNYYSYGHYKNSPLNTIEWADTFD